MEVDLHSFGNSLNTFIERNQPNEAERFITQINKAFTEGELASITIDTYLLNIFNKDTGLLNFLITVVGKSEYHKAKLKCFELLYTLVNNSTSKVQKNVVNIIKACRKIIPSSANIIEKRKSLELLTLIIQKVDFHTDHEINVDNEIADLYSSTLFNSLHCRFDKSNTVQEELLVTIGAVTKKFPAFITNPIELRTTLINQLNRELQKSDHKSFPVITGCVTALSNYLENFPFDPLEDKSVADTLYKCVKILADPRDAARRVAYRESLSLVAKHMMLFENALYAEAQWWHITLLKWFNLGVEDKKAVSNVLETFYRAMASILSRQNENYDSELFKYFIDYFIEVITKATSENCRLENYEIREAIRGFGFLACAFKLHITPQEINKSYVTISKIMEFTYILNHEPDADQIMYLPNYIQTLSFMTRNLPQLNNTHLICLQSVSILMIKIFPQVSPAHHRLVIDAFALTCFQLLQCKNNILDTFLQNVVYQGVLWTCSHSIALDAELLKDEKQPITTYKNYLSLWNGYLSIIHFTKYEKYEITTKIRKTIVCKLLDELIRTLFVLMNKLNLDTKLKNTEQPITDPGAAYEALQTNDFVVFINIVDFYQDVLEKIEPVIFKKWIITYLNLVIVKSIKNPLVSGFYKLAAACLKISDKLNYFNDSRTSDKEDVSACYRLVNKYLQEVLWKIKQFKGDLQIACLHAILAAPVCFIKDILPCAVPAFITLFSVGRSYLQLANLGIDTLERWLKHLPLDDFEPFLKQVLPSLDSYLKSRSLGGSLTSGVQLKTRKTVQAVNKRKILVQTEPELFKLQIKILSFVGQLNTNLCTSFVNSGNNVQSVVWNRKLHLKLTLPYNNTKLNLYLDKFIPRIVELSLYSSDRKIRIAACELLQGIVMLVLGISHRLEPTILKDLNGLMKAVIEPVVRLGCDMDEMVQQLFAPLARQLMHYYSHPRQMYSSHTQIVIETLIETISNPSDPALRDFSGDCIKEFVTWTIKQADKEELRKNPINIKLWIRTIQSFSVHPDPFKRLGAALIFNNIYTILREESYMFSMFWLEILYAFVINLSLTQVNNVDDNNCIEHVSQALNHIQRGFVEKHKLFNETDKERRKPSGIEGTLLKDVAVWLLDETGSENAHCRQKCMTMFCKIAPLVKNCKNNLNSFKELYLKNNPEWITLTYEKELLRNATLKDLHNCESINDVFKWMEGLLCALEGYIFVIPNNLIPVEYTSQKSKFIDSLRFFLEHVQVQSIQEVINIIPKSENILHTAAEKETFNYLKSTIVTKIMEFATILLENATNFTYITTSPQLFWGSSLWDLISHRIFDPQSLGFDLTNFNKEDVLLNLLNQFSDSSLVDVNGLTNALSAYIINTFVAYTDVGLNSVPLKQRQLITGMLLLQQSGLAQKLNIKKYTTGTVKSVFSGLIEIKNEEKLIKKLHKSAYNFCDTKLQLALEDEQEFCELVKLLCNSTKVKNEQREEVQYEVYFFEQFKETIIKYILKNYTMFINGICKPEAAGCEITYLTEILKYIRRNSKSIKQETVQSIVRITVENWEKMLKRFSSSSTENMLGLELISHLSQITIEPLQNLVTKENPSMVQWVINLLNFEDPQWTKEVSLNFYSEVFTVLGYVIGSSDTCGMELRNALQKLKKKYFDVESNLETMLITTFKRLLNAMKASKSIILLELVAEIYATSFLSTKQIDIKYTLKPFTRYTSTENQANSIRLIYEMCFNTTKFTSSQRYILAKDILPSLIHNCRYSVFEQFYGGIIASILSILDKKENAASFSMVQVVNKTIAYIVVELLFARIKTENFSDDSCIISNAAYPEKLPSNKDLLKTLTRNTLEACKEKYNLQTQEEREVFRLYNCHSYNALVSIISNTQKEITHYDNWLFGREDREKQDILWKNLIDTNKKYVFEIDFDKVPSMRKVVINIRNDIFNTKRNIEPQARTVKYIESQHLFKSTLSEDITKFDFTHTVLRSQPEQTEPSSEHIETRQESQIVLESSDINTHECMATICGLIQHLVENEISPLPTENEDVTLPKWMKSIRNVMMSENTHDNVKIFLANIIYNTQYIFKSYAKWFFAPVIKVIVDGCIGNNMNFFIADLVIMLTTWSNVATPTDDKLLASKLLKFLMENADNDRRNVFKTNLDYIKLVIEAWKPCLEIPYDMIVSKLQVKETSQKLDVGIHLAAILLANGIPPWQPNESKNFLMTLCKVLKSAHRSVYQPGAEVLGLSLQYMSTDQATAGQLTKFTDYLHKQLLKIKDDDNKFAYCLQGLVLYYPTVADNYLVNLVMKLNHVFGNFKCTYLKIFLARIETLHSINELSSIDFKKLLSEENLEAQLLTLEMIEKSVHHLTNLIPILKDVSKFTNNSFTICRTAMYNIFIAAYNIHFTQQDETSQEITKICRDALLQGFTDKETVIQEKINEFWSNSSNLPAEIPQIFLFLLNTMYKPNIEEHYVGYCTYLLLNTLKCTEEFGEKLFEYALYECDFQDYNLICDWRRQHASIAPLFADTLRSQEFTINPMNPNVLRATVSTLEFQPTQMTPASSSHGFKYSTNPTSSLLFSVTQNDETRTSEFKDPNYVLPVNDIKRSRRFLRDKSKVSRHCAYLEARKSVTAEERRKERVKQSERDVNVCRKYRIGDYPDIEITLSSIITPLQILVRCDATLARCLYTTIFQSLVNKMQKDDATDNTVFIQNISSSITNIFNSSTQFVPSTIGTFLDIALKYKSSMHFHPNIISSVCQGSGLLSVGSLLLEEYLISEVEDEIPAKKSKGVESPATNHWVKFAELYKEMDEWDVVSAVFMEKMNCNEVVLQAVEAESSGQWRSAQDFYARVIEEDSSEERKDFYYESYFKCFAALAEWDKLSNVIEHTVVTDNQSNVWASLWDNDWNQEKLLPWYITSEMRNVLSGIDKQLFATINEYLIDPKKSEYLKSNFGEELSMLCLLQNDVDTADHYLNHSITYFLENWSHLNPLFAKVRARKVLNLRNMIEIYLFIKLFNDLNMNNQETVLEALLKSWKDTLCDSIEPLLSCETRSVYRNQFISVLKTKLNSLVDDDEKQIVDGNLNKCKFNIHMNLVENALQQGNYYVARKYIKLSVKPNQKSNIENMQWSLALSKILYLRAQTLENSEEKLSLMVDAWSKLGTPSITAAQDNILCCFIKTKEHMYEVTQEIYKIVSGDNQLFNQKQKELTQLMDNISSNNVESIWKFGTTNLQDSLDICENEIQNMMHNENLKVFTHMSSAYVKLAYCVQDKGKAFEENFIIYVLRAMKLGSVEGKQLFPCLFNIDIGTTHKNTFLKESTEIPTWMYLAWLPQLLANLDSSAIFVIADIIIKIADVYPQAIMYPYRLSRELYNFKDDGIGTLGKRIMESLDETLLNGDLIEKFLKAMAYVTSPSNVLRYHIMKLIRASSSKEHFSEAYQKLFDELYSEIPDHRDPKSMQGAMFKKIAKYEAKLKTIFKKKFNTEAYLKDLKALEEDVRKLEYKRSSKLVDYSPWLANFQETELHANLEIPGQYTGEKRPLVQYHTKIMGFSPTLLLLKSLRAPMRITMLGNDGKEYHFLNKFGEDLRQDQRIEQIFNLMNKILIHDSECAKRQLSICTYQVIPLNNRLGIIEWVNKTRELKDFVEDGISDKLEKENYINSSGEYLTWIDKATPPGLKAKATDAEKYGIACQTYKRDAAICKYKAFVSNLPWDVLRKSFWNISVNSESFFALRQKFATSYAVICISHWILGIGDRHLSNTLISLCSGEAIGIDFGHAFGTGTQILGIPELVPFRLTPHILGLLQPMNEHGLLQETMIHCLKTFRKNSSMLLATMSVFIKEPSLDWLEFARRSEITSRQALPQEWYPNQKIEHAQRKLEGVNPANITIEELKAGHSHSKYLNAYIDVVRGNPSYNFRARKRDNLSEEDQVKCLLDHATDYNLLGRMYVGWQAWV